MAKRAHKFAVLGIEALTMLFWFAGFIAMAVYVGRISFCTGKVCNALRAVVVFAAFEWLLWLATTILAALESSHSRGAVATAGTEHPEQGMCGRENSDQNVDKEY
jgi:hypothetical protein